MAEPAISETTEDSVSARHQQYAPDLTLLSRNCERKEEVSSSASLPSPSLFCYNQELTLIVESVEGERGEGDEGGLRMEGKERDQLLVETTSSFSNCFWKRRSGRKDELTTRAHTPLTVHPILWGDQAVPADCRRSRSRISSDEGRKRAQSRGGGRSLSLERSADSQSQRRTRPRTRPCSWSCRPPLSEEEGIRASWWLEGKGGRRRARRTSQSSRRPKIPEVWSARFWATPFFSYLIGHSLRRSVSRLCNKGRVISIYSPAGEGKNEHPHSSSAVDSASLVLLSEFTSRSFEARPCRSHQWKEMESGGRRGWSWTGKQRPVPKEQARTRS